MVVLGIFRFEPIDERIVEIQEYWNAAINGIPVTGAFAQEDAAIDLSAKVVNRETESF
ncbi:MAG: hypothetical protein ACREVY_00035 [Gammaproteobacteria bacterium]